MFFRTTFTALGCLALCLSPGAAHADKPAAAMLLAAYRHMDTAAVRRDIKGYMAYDAPEFVTGVGNHVNRARAASIVGMQMRYALWFKSKTRVRRIAVQGQTAKVETQLHQEFLSAFLMPDGKRQKYVFDYWNADTWDRRSGRWWRISSSTVGMRVTINGKLRANKQVRP